MIKTLKLSIATVVILLCLSTQVNAQSTKKFEKATTEEAIQTLETKKKASGLSKHEKEKLKYLKRKQKTDAKRLKRREQNSKFND